MSVDTTDLDRFSNELLEVEKQLFEVQLPKAGLVYGTQVQGIARRLVPVDLGALKLSITRVVRKAGSGVIVEVGPTQKYGKGIEEGRPPHYVSPAALSGWAKRKGLNPYAVSKAIEKKGTRAQPYMAPAFEKTQGLQDKFVVAAITEAVKTVFVK